MNSLRVIAAIAAFVLLVLGLSYSCTQWGLFIEGEVKEQRVENRYEAHEGSQAKIEGTIQTLQNVRRNYLKADNEAMRGALRQEAINAANRIEDAEIKRKSEGLYEWLQKIRDERYNPNGDLETSTEN